MSQNTNTVPKVGFVSLGCPKNLVDSERILTELRTDGYQVVPSYDDADVVIVNTCGFIDSAVQESLEAIGEALAENGKVIVTGCLGAKEDQIREVHPKVLEITGPHSYEQVLANVRKYVPKPAHDPFTSLVPEQGVKLTPRHYAYLKISEGCNHRCTFCIIPSMRGDLDSRPVGEVLSEAQRLVEAGVKELLVISQDTSAYGADIKHRTGLPWQRCLIIGHFAVMDKSGIPGIHRFKRLNFRGIHFDHIPPANHLVIHHHQNAAIGRRLIRCQNHCIIEIQRAVRAQCRGRTHCPHQHNRLMARYCQVKKIRGLLQRIGAVSDDKSVRFITGPVDFFCQRQPHLVIHIL